MPLNLKPRYAGAPYRVFRGVGDTFSEKVIELGTITKTFDEPTYLTFRLFFSAEDTESANTNFDKFPQPLFSEYKEDDIAVRNFYSSYQYLRDCNEFVRADMLLEFIEKWNDIQNNHQWYFQRIEGLETLLNINTERGRRASGDARLRIVMLEALDWRITHLMNLYRKIAWDDTYQRWILPDMMRNFRMTMTVTEFRSFHRSNHSYWSLAGENAIGEASNLIRDNFSGRIPDALGAAKDYAEGQVPMILSLMEGITPIQMFQFDRCEFDLSSFEILPGTLTVGDAEMREVAFDIKVGNYKEDYINPIFNFFYNDILINGYDRAVESAVPVTKLESTDATVNPLIGSIAQGETLRPKKHVSGKPWTESGLLNTLQIIPGLGPNIAEAVATIQSKNVFSILGLARRSISDILKDTLPSQELGSGLIDSSFRDFLGGITQSQATDPETLELQAAANQALNNEGIWEEIKDLSLATNLVSDALNEIDTPNPVENPTSLREIYNSDPYVEVPVVDGLIIEGVPSSLVTENDLVGGGPLQRPEQGLAGSSNLVTEDNLQTPDSDSTDGDIQAGDQITSSIELGANAGESLPIAPSELGDNAGGNLDQPEPGVATSEGDVQGGLETAEIAEGKIEGGILDQPEPGEAVDGDPLEGEKLDLPEPSQATKGNIQE